MMLRYSFDFEEEAKDIEITLDFLQPNGIFGKFFKKIVKSH